MISNKVTTTVADMYNFSLLLLPRKFIHNFLCLSRTYFIYLYTKIVNVFSTACFENDVIIWKVIVAKFFLYVFQGTIASTRLISILQIF